MSLSSLLDRIQPYCTNWNRTGTGQTLIKLVEEGQDELINSAPDYMIYKDTSNLGWPPYLITVAGTYRYSVTAANLASAAITKTINGVAYNVRCKRVKRIFEDVTNKAYDYDKRFKGVPYVYYNLNPYSMATSKIFVVDFPFSQQEALESDTCYVEFFEDMGTSSAQYFIEFEWEAPRLTAESIGLVIPLRFESALEGYVIGKISELNTGKMSDRMTNFYNFWIPEFKKMVYSDVGKYVDSKVETRTC